MVKDLKWETLEERREKSSLTLLYKLLHHEIAVPQRYHPAPYASSNRRAGEHCLRVYQPSLDAYKYSFLPRTVVSWNRLPAAVAGSPTLDHFKVQLATLTLN